MKTLKQGTPVRVVWQDAFTKSGWWNEKDLRNSLEKEKYVITCGIFIFQDKDWMILCLSDTQDDNYDRWNTPKGIPNKWIKEIKVLK